MLRGDARPIRVSTSATSRRSSAAAHAAGAIVVADNTTMTPYGQRPLDLGADIVVAADTKAPNGHSDALFGHVASRDETVIAAVKELAQAVRRDPRPVRGMAGASRPGDAGGSFRPHVLVRPSIIAARLKSHPEVKALRFPGLRGSTRRTIWPRVQMDALRLADRTDAGSAEAARRASSTAAR